MSSDLAVYNDVWEPDRVELSVPAGKLTPLLRPVNAQLLLLVADLKMLSLGRSSNNLDLLTCTLYLLEYILAGFWLILSHAAFVFVDEAL